nr:LLDR protein Lu1-18070 [Linum usitatissimum]FAA04146.1 TPA: flax LLDR protein Lu1-18070 [Linum usitatissimum]
MASSFSSPATAFTALTTTVSSLPTKPVISAASFPNIPKTHRRTLPIKSGSADSGMIPIGQVFGKAGDSGMIPVGQVFGKDAEGSTGGDSGMIPVGEVFGKTK